jgi:hypothetical protein
MLPLSELPFASALTLVTRAGTPRCPEAFSDPGPPSWPAVRKARTARPGRPGPLVPYGCRSWHGRAAQGEVPVAQAAGAERGAQAADAGRRRRGPDPASEPRPPPGPVPDRHRPVHTDAGRADCVRALLTAGHQRIPGLAPCEVTPLVLARRGGHTCLATRRHIAATARQPVSGTAAGRDTRGCGSRTSLPASWHDHLAAQQGPRRGRRVCSSGDRHLPRDVIRPPAGG